ncbi:amino acid adenylation domain-containing protein (plasmid) [Leptolyngbya sp. NIES-3755]|nr:amino acid adenylation domain-containing protein [Leptolyngbya sp. NIES-3755]
MQDPIITGYKLSPQQQRLWALQASGDRYVAQCVIRLREIDVDRLHTALQAVMNRHDSLRTTFGRRAGMKQPLQVIHPVASVIWRHLDLSGEDSKTQASQIEQFITAEQGEFDSLEQLPLLRSLLLALSSQEFLLVLTLPALCADTKSLRNLLKDLFQAYTHNSTDQISPEEVVQYVQFSEWQNELLQENTTAESYWQRDSSTSMQLPFGLITPRITSFEPQVHSVPISPAINAQLHATAERYDVSIALFLLACWQVLIRRLTGQTEITTGVVWSYQQYEELETVVGLLSQSLPLKSCLTEEMLFSEVLRQIHQTWQEMEEWQDDFPGLKDQEFFPLSFEFFEQLPQSTPELFWKIDRQQVYSDRFDLKLNSFTQSGHLTIELQYNSNLFSTQAIACLASQLQTLLNSASQPECPIAQLNLLSAEDRNQLLVQWNNTAVDHPLNECLPQEFEQQVKRTPDAIALVFENHSITYRELNNQANQLAHYLQQCGAVPDVPIAIHLERSLDLIIAILGVMKAGSAYLPLDPALPTDGLEFRLQDAQVSLVITQRSLLNRLPESLSQVICLDHDRAAIAQSSSENSNLAIVPTNIAYIIYTSGSTGQPKGVAIEHRQILNYLHSISARLDFPSNASYAIASTLAADLSYTMLFPCLCSGGCLHIIAAERTCDAQALVEYFSQHPIDCLKIVPSHLQALLDCPDSSKILPRQRLILGGEVCRWSLIEQIQQQMPTCEIFNHYGPTETTVGALTHAVKPESLTERISETVPIGRAIDNTQLYVLDSNGNPVSIGVTGELYIGGAGLARGYLNRPDLTAEKFISHQLNHRLYKTGDLVRYLPDGTLEFLGRVDQQVKLHGFRIELGEIEATLLHHPDVKESVVLLREDDPKNLVLTAYVVPKSTISIPVLELRQFLKQKLPEYMIPATFVELKALPLTINGKVDRHALPTPEKSRSTQSYVAPRNSVEATIAAIWSEILGLETIGIYDNFFELGGHSLLATQVLARLRQTFQVELPLRQLFEAHTVAEVAEQIEAILLAEIEGLTETEAQELVQKVR